jgi:hypothetical protein
LYLRLNSYNENIYLEIRGALEQNKRDSYSQAISSEIKKVCGNMFEISESPPHATITIMISLDRIENNIETTKPQTVYSKFVSGYNRVPNQAYYTANAEAERARLELNRLASTYTRGWGAAILNGIAQGVWQAQLQRCLQIMNSEAAFDKVPIYLDYTYSKTGLAINNLVQIPYKIYDMKSRTLYREDTITEKTKTEVAILEGVHPDDANYLKNSEKFDYEKQDKEFQLFLDNIMDKFASKVANETMQVFKSRAEDYSKMGELAEAIDSYLTYWRIINLRSLFPTYCPRNGRIN